MITSAARSTTSPVPTSARSVPASCPRRTSSSNTAVTLPRTSTSRGSLQTVRPASGENTVNRRVNRISGEPLSARTKVSHPRPPSSRACRARASSAEKLSRVTARISVSRSGKRR
ncbi:hypothetical protein ADL05_12535 [Nocardiopsis sp. NRRL B-16309]|nr:hypothetical protein ADL05_12535 [Nocardiopsis sp. NRRL B-16309]